MILTSRWIAALNPFAITQNRFVAILPGSVDCRIWRLRWSRDNGESAFISVVVFIAEHPTTVMKHRYNNISDDFRSQIRHKPSAHAMR